MLNAEPNIVFNIQHFYVARKGFEPLQTVPKTVVLPLDDRAIFLYCERKGKGLFNNFKKHS